jgi:oxygen-independent coproporphyrinogen-3 oxidase
MQIKKLYITKTKFNNLPQECIVLIHVFYPEYSIELTSKEDRSDISIEINDDSFYIRLEKTRSSYRRQIDNDLRRQIKVALFEQLVKEAQYYPPWGILQGIRPTKLVFKIKNTLSEKLTILSQFEVIESILINDYKLSPEMASLALEVAAYEEEFLKAPSTAKRPLASIYLGIPYCPTRCLYCSFPSNGIEKYQQTHQEYLMALKKELDQILPLVHENYTLRALYIGGGTPTTLSAKELENLLLAIHQIVPLDKFQEITVEAGRPDTITQEKLMVLKKYGVQRISINPQSMNQETLDLIGRKHSVEAIKDAFNLARKVGIQRINMDIILGLPNEHIEHVEQTFKALEKLMPSEVTVHTLAIKNSSRLKENQEAYSLANRNEMEEILDYSREFLIHRMHMKPYYLYRQKNMVASYENIGYTSGQPCMYNMQIIEEATSIFAFGAGASTKIRDQKGQIERVENVKNIDIYIDRIDEMIERKRIYFTENKE